MASTWKELRHENQQLKAQVEYWKQAYRKAVSHDGRIIDTLKEAQHGAAE